MFTLIEKSPGWFQARYQSREHETWVESDCPLDALYRTARAIRSRFKTRRRK